MYEKIKEYLQHTPASMLRACASERQVRVATISMGPTLIAFGQGLSLSGALKDLEADLIRATVSDYENVITDSNTYARHYCTTGGGEESLVDKALLRNKMLKVFCNGREEGHEEKPYHAELISFVIPDNHLSEPGKRSVIVGHWIQRAQHLNFDIVLEEVPQAEPVAA